MAATITRALNPHIAAERTRVVHEREFAIRRPGEIDMILKRERFTGRLIVDYSEGTAGKAVAEQKQVI